jgi:hypothetical protein
MMILFPFNFQDTGTGVSHGFRRFERKLFRQDAEMHANKYVGRDWQGLTVEVRAGSTCHICGFAMVTLAFPNGWVMDACSADRLDKTLTSQGLMAWVNQLDEQHSYNRSLLKSKVLNLQPPGE